MASVPNWIFTKTRLVKPRFKIAARCFFELFYISFCFDVYKVIKVVGDPGWSSGLTHYVKTKRERRCPSSRQRDAYNFSFSFTATT